MWPPPGLAGRPQLNHHPRLVIVLLTVWTIIVVVSLRPGEQLSPDFGGGEPRGTLEDRQQ